MKPLVTFDLFSALIDSRTGGSAAWGQLARERRWSVSGEALYDTWDQLNKASQRDETTWVPFSEHSRRAALQTYERYDLEGDPAADTAWVLSTVGNWPMWPDVATGLAVVGRRSSIGILSNVDDEIFQRTQPAQFIGDNLVFTSERLQSYKPSPQLYLRAAELSGGHFVHVASSARDVRGALEAGMTTIRLRRPGHEVDPSGPNASWEAGTVAEVAAVLENLSASSG